MTKGDEVLCQSFTFSASANPIVYQGATPIFIDSEPDTWNMSPELLMSDRIKELFDSVSDEYDYVIVDTAPFMLVTDTLIISEYAGHTIYVTRADYTEKQILNFAKELHISNKLKGMMLVVNDVNERNFGYGANYGYYGAPVKKGFFRKRT